MEKIYYKYVIINLNKHEKMQNPAMKKRILILLALFVVLGIFGAVFFYAISPEPTCTDGKKNQAEKNVDCGGPCSPCKDITQTREIVVQSATVVFGGNETYDAVAKIENFNDSVGASSFKYVFSLKDANGTVLATREGTSFILPADSRYIAELGFQFEGGVVPKTVELSITDVKWEKLNEIGKPQIGVYSKNFGKNAMGVGGEVDGIIRNESGYDLGRISIVIILFDDKGEIIGVNKTEKNAVRTKEERDFRLNWPYQLSGPVRNIEVDAQSNVFDRQNLSFSVQ